MKNITHTCHYVLCTYDELTAADRQLIDAAKAATQRSYAPYSHFHVGAAALLADGTVITGTNQENAAYPSGLCAERTTLFYAGSAHPDKPVVALAIAAYTDEIAKTKPFPLLVKVEKGDQVIVNQIIEINQWSGDNISLDKVGLES